MIDTIELPYKFRLRWYQREAWNKLFVDNILQLMCIWHRRSGKDDMSINLLGAAAMKEVGNYGYLLPEYNQARKVVWQGITEEGTRFLDRIPPQLIHSVHNQQMLIKLVNGSTIQLGGSNNVDSLMGTNFKGIIFSEYSLQAPRARQYLRPILVKNGGWEIIQGTPRGMNHMYKLYKNVVNNPSWYCSHVSVNDSYDHNGKPIISPLMIQQEREQGVPEEIIQSEYYCDFSSAVLGAYYAEDLRRAIREERIGTFPPRKGINVTTAWDFGQGDATAIWFIQIINHNFYIIGYYENNQKPFSHYAQYVQEWAKKHDLYFDKHAAPHDVINREYFGSGKTRLDEARDTYGIHFELVPRTRDVKDDINHVKKMFPRFYFDRQACSAGLEALTEYHAEYDIIDGVYKDKPKHNWASHGADALRTFVMYYHPNHYQPPLICYNTYGENHG